MLNLSILLEDSAREVPERTAIVFEETKLSYLIAWSKANMADYKYPRVIEFRETLPMTATGKILKSELR
jgi:non-ribosomal peptide synthetase component E (peptide arylation enzyme)